MDDLVERLRQFDEFGNGRPGDARFSGIAIEAADRIAQIEGAFHKRMHIYRMKRDAADPLGEDCYSRHEAFELVVEAFEIFETESGIRASLIREQDDDIRSLSRHS